MEFLIADTFTDSLSRLTGQARKAVKTTAFDLQLNPANPGMHFRKLDRAKDPNFSSVRANADIRLIVHKTAPCPMLCCVGKHDDGYGRAEWPLLDVSCLHIRNRQFVTGLGSGPETAGRRLLSAIERRSGLQLGQNPGFVCGSCRMAYNYDVFRDLTCRADDQERRFASLFTGAVEKGRMVVDISVCYKPGGAGAVPLGSGSKDSLQRSRTRSGAPALYRWEADQKKIFISTPTKGTKAPALYRWEADQKTFMSHLAC